MKYCGKCGYKNGDDAAFCGNCGEPFQRVINQELPYYYGEKNKKSVLMPVLVSLVLVLVSLITVVVVKTVLFPSKTVIDQTKMHDTSDKKELPDEGDGIGQLDKSYEPEKKNDLIDIRHVDSIIAGDENHANVSVYVIDLKNEVSYATNNANYAMSASAMVNIPVLYTISKEMEMGRSMWSTPIRFRHRYSGRGTLTAKQNDEYFSQMELVNEVLNYSDNNATNSLVDYYGREFINNLCNNNSYISVDIQRYLGESSNVRDNYISARDTAEMLAEMYTSTDSGVDKSFLVSKFRIFDSARYTGVGKNLPSNVNFSNHNAVTSTIYNEVAIVESDKVNYIIAVLSNNGKMETSATTVSRISDYVYNALSR